MSQTYADHKRTKIASQERDKAKAQPDVLSALRAGSIAPPPEQSGHRVDLPEAMRAKMENAFGADLSAVKLYESQAVADAGAQAVTRGSDIAFAPGMLDFTSFGGQSLLGHEMSHVVSQARGEVSGRGFLNDSALEARADREGAMAAAGQQIAMPTAAMSSVTAAPAAGPMQAKKPKQQEQAQNEDILISGPTGGHKMGETLPDKPKTEAPKPASVGLNAAKGLAGVASIGSAMSAAKLPAKPSGPAPVPVAAMMKGMKGFAGSLGTGIAEKAAADRKAKEEAEAGDDDEENIFEQSAGALDTATGQLADLPDTLDPVGQVQDKIQEVKDMFTFSEDEPDTETPVDKQLADAVSGAEMPSGLEKAAQAGNVANKAVGAMNNGVDFVKSFGGVQDAVETGSEDEKRNALFDVADKGLATGGGISDLVSTAASTRIDPKHAAALAKAKELNTELTPKQISDLKLNSDTLAATKKATGVMERADMASGIIGGIQSGLTTVKETANAISASHREKAMAESLEQMNARKGERSEEDEEMLQAFEQGHTSAGIDKYSSRMKAISAGIATAGNVANLAGAPPLVGALLSGTSTAVGKWGEMKTDYLTDEFHENTVDKKIGLKDQIAEFKKRYGHLNLSDEQIQEAILRSKGAASGEMDEMFQNITEKRAANIVQKAKDGNADAQAYTANAKVDYNAKNASTGVEKSLGLQEKKKYNDSRAWVYDAFKENADKEDKWKEETEFMTNGQKAKHFLGQQASALGEKFKTGGKQVAAGAKKAWGGLKHIGGGLKKAGINAINFMVDPMTREETLKNMKTGAGSAAKKVGEGFKKFGTGVKNAGINAINFMVDPMTREAAMKKAGEHLKTNANVVSHAFKKKKDDITDWYHKGVDQLNVNRASYNKMSRFDRFKWSMQNLPARMMAGTQKAYMGTVKRTNAQVNSGEAVKHMQETMAAEAEEEKKKKAAGA